MRSAVSFAVIVMCPFSSIAAVSPALLSFWITSERESEAEMVMLAPLEKVIVPAVCPKKAASFRSVTSTEPVRVDDSGSGLACS